MRIHSTPGSKSPMREWQSNSTKVGSILEIWVVRTASTHKDGKSSSALENEHGQNLLECQPNDHCSPLDGLVVCGENEEAELEDEQPENTLSSLAVACAVVQSKSIGCSKDQSQESQPAQTETDSAAKLHEGSFHGRNPCTLNGSRERGRGHILEEDETDEKPHNHGNFKRGDKHQS